MTIPVFIPTDNIKTVEPYGNHYNLEDIQKELHEGKAQLWILWNEKRKNKYQGCIVTKILKRSNTKALNLFIVTGKDKKSWQDKIATLEDYAKQEGCTHLD